MKTDKLSITILDDGTIKLDADRISMPNHTSAEKFVAEIARLAGGTTDIKKKTGYHSHGQHTHAHEGAKHSH